MDSKKHEYSEAKQKLLIDILMSSEEVFIRCQNILKPQYWNQKFRKAIKYILDYVDDHKALPKIQQLNVETQSNFELIPDINTHHIEAFLQEIEEFCKNRALAEAVLSAVDLIEKGNYGEVEKRVRDAILISLVSDVGTDYFADPRERLNRIKSNNGQVSTGWKTVDQKLYGGVNRGEITIWAAPSGVGKSLFLQNLSLSFVKQKLNVIYISLELSEELTSMRVDSMLTGVATTDIFRKLDDVEIKVKQTSRSSGTFHIKQMPQGSTTNDIKAYLKAYEIKTGQRADALIVDYLDLLYPNNKKINPSDLFIKDKFVAEELRGLAVERKILCMTASQLNRGSINEQEHDQSMIAGGISKIHTADNVITIYATQAMKERGQYQIQFIKTRSSSGVGSKLFLGYDPATLKIFDLEDQGQVQQAQAGVVTDVLADLRRKSTQPPPKSDTQPPVAASKMQDLSKLTSLIRR
jgi:replicative DNA helicase